MDLYLAKYFKSALILCLMAANIHAAQWAKVISPKAVIFADPAMSSPIGYFSQGQKIRVGEVPRNKGRVLPTVYKKKVVYVRMIDLETSKDLSLVRSATERMKDREAKEAIKATRLGAGVSLYGASASDIESEGSSSGLFLGGLNINGAKFSPEKDHHYIVNMDYLSGSKGDAHLSLILFGVGATYELIKTDYFDLGIYGLVEFSPWAQYEVDSLFKVNGYGAGLSAGLETDFKFSQSWSLTATGGYRYLKLFGFNLPDSTAEYEIQEEFSPALHGLALTGALSYHW